VTPDCQAAAAHDFITGCPKRYDTPVAKREGFGLAGGGAKRIAIGRGPNYKECAYPACSDEATARST